MSWGKSRVETGRYRIDRAVRFLGCAVLVVELHILDRTELFQVDKERLSDGIGWIRRVTGALQIKAGDSTRNVKARIPGEPTVDGFPAIDIFLRIARSLEVF